MITQLKYVTVIIKDYEEALQWYTQSLQLEVRMNVDKGSLRWLTVGIPGQKYPEIILQKPIAEEYSPEEQKKKLSQIGNGTTWVFEVDNCVETVERLRRKQVKIVEEPVASPWGTSALIADLYGNLFTLTESKKTP